MRGVVLPSDAEREEFVSGAMRVSVALREMEEVTLQGSYPE